MLGAMADLDPFDPKWGVLPVVRGGPGAHSDEASVALPDLAGQLPPDVRSTLEDVSENPGTEGEAPDPTRYDADDEGDGILSHEELFLPALLVTGMWGGDPAGRGRVITGAVELPGFRFVHPNPFVPPGARPQIPLGFAARMDELTVVLEGLEALCVARYNARWPAILEERRRKWEKAHPPGTSPFGSYADSQRDAWQKREARRALLGAPSIPFEEDWNRPWIELFAKLRRAVDVVREELRAGSPSIFRTVEVIALHAGKPRARTEVRVFGERWGVLAETGNVKLPFVSYSELPGVTCPGAGACLVSYDHYGRVAERREENLVRVRRKLPTLPAPEKGWCYSFKEWRYPDGYGRQFLNTLAQYADREFAIRAGGGPEDPTQYEARVQAALRGSSARSWPQYVKVRMVRATERDRTTHTRKGRKVAGKKAFVRLFVDGDINYEDCILEWMRVCEQIGPPIKGRPASGTALQPKQATGPRPEPLFVYGYSKCWQQFINANALLGGVWPTNYVMNMSSGSVYDTNRKVAERVSELPITRGWFKAVDLHAYLHVLDVQTRLFQEALRTHGGRRVTAVPIPPPTPAERAGWALDRPLVRAFLYINGVSGETETAVAYLRRLPLLEDFDVPRKASGAPEAIDLDDVRRRAFVAYLTQQLRTPAFLQRVREGLKGDERWEAAEDRAARRLLNLQLAQGDVEATKAMMDKALALALHDVLWTYGIGGSCPLVCGNCSDNPESPKGGVHRCASNDLFRKRTIHIGLH